MRGVPLSLRHLALRNTHTGVCLALPCETRIGLQELQEVSGATHGARLPGSGTWLPLEWLGAPRQHPGPNYSLIPALEIYSSGPWKPPKSKFFTWHVEYKDERTRFLLSRTFTFAWHPCDTGRAGMMMRQWRFTAHLLCGGHCDWQLPCSPPLSHNRETRNALKISDFFPLRLMGTHLVAKPDLHW